MKGSNYEKVIYSDRVLFLLVFSGCTAKYQRISFDSDTLGENLANHINADTKVENTVNADFPDQLPIYKIIERNIYQEEYEQMLEALSIPKNPEHLTLEGNSLFYSVVGFVDTSRGYFDMSEEEAEKLAWEIFNKIPFLEGEWECTGIRSSYTISNSSGSHISRADNIVESPEVPQMYRIFIELPRSYLDFEEGRFYSPVSAVTRRSPFENFWVWETSE